MNLLILILNLIKMHIAKEYFFIFNLEIIIYYIVYPEFCLKCIFTCDKIIQLQICKSEIILTIRTPLTNTWILRLY